MTEWLSLFCASSLNKYVGGNVYKFSSILLNVLLIIACSVILMLTHSDRGWMYKRKEDGYLSETYKESVEHFLDVAFSNEAIVDKNCIKCPCSKCKNLPYKTRDDVKLHLQQYGFIPNYTTWWAHGETTTFQHEVQPPNPMEDDDLDGCSRMVTANSKSHSI